jgi:hypothetical protein
MLAVLMGNSRLASLEFGECTVQRSSGGLDAGVKGDLECEKEFIQNIRLRK